MFAKTIKTHKTERKNPDNTINNQMKALFENILKNNSKWFVVIIFLTYSIVCWISKFLVFSSIGVNKNKVIHTKNIKKEAKMYFLLSLKNNFTKVT